MSDTTPVLECTRTDPGISRGRAECAVLSGVDLRVEAGSASPSSAVPAAARAPCCTCSAGLDVPDAGEVRVAGEALNRMGDARRGRLRNQHLGFVYQFHHLLPDSRPWRTWPCRC
jgi:lipoprotein-releasing system ATP-binding protein